MNSIEPRKADEVIDGIFHLYRARGDQAYLGEPVSMTDHMLQSAALAEAAGAAPAVVAATLLHDLGHLVHGLADDAADHGIDTAHEEVAARWLAPWFGPEVVEPIRLHVAAKRYLCAIEPGYLARLSPASVLSLSLQGGPFDDADSAAFAALPHAAAAVELRRYDDEGKSAAAVTPTLEHFRAGLVAIVTS